MRNPTGAASPARLYTAALKPARIHHRSALSALKVARLRRLVLFLSLAGALQQQQKGSAVFLGHLADYVGQPPRLYFLQYVDAAVDVQLVRRVQTEKPRRAPSILSSAAIAATSVLSGIRRLDRPPQLRTYAVQPLKGFLARRPRRLFGNARQRTHIGFPRAVLGYTELAAYLSVGRPPRNHSSQIAARARLSADALRGS
jgi:hypothetical protein